MEKCDCGGRLEKIRLETFDFSWYVGIPVELRGVQGLRCDSCGFTTLSGQTINRAQESLVLTIANKREILNGPEARVLRGYLELTQAELAERMGITRETVARWEGGGTLISPHHDYILRTFIFVDLKKRSLDDALGSLDSLREVHTELSKVKAPPPFIIDSLVRREGGRKRR